MAKNAIVGQSGGPTSVINASLAGVYESCKRRGAGKVYGMLHGVAGLLERRTCVLDEKLKTALDIELLKRTPSSYLGSCRYKLPDWHTPEGAAVTTSRYDVNYVVTEYGIAQLKGKTLRERARELIKIAHPDFREGLIKVYEERFHAKF